MGKRIENLKKNPYFWGMLGINIILACIFGRKTREVESSFWLYFAMLNALDLFVWVKGAVGSTFASSIIEDLALSKKGKKKYELVKDDFIGYDRKTLCRIRALRDFSDVKKGDLGGYIEKEENLSHEGNAWIYDDAYVYDNARVRDDARVSGNACISYDVLIYDNARVYGNAKISGGAFVHREDWPEDVRIGSVRVYGHAQVYGNAQVEGCVEVYDDAQVYGHARVYGGGWICEDVEISGKAKVYGSADVYYGVWVAGNAHVYGAAQVCSNIKVSGNMDMLEMEEMRYLKNKALYASTQQLSAAYAEAREMIKVGRVIPLDDLLRQMLDRVADEVRGAINDGAQVTEDDLAMLCTELVKATYETDTPWRNDHVHTLFKMSRDTLKGMIKIEKYEEIACKISIYPDVSKS